jgi:histone H3/H4
MRRKTTLKVAPTMQIKQPEAKEAKEIKVEPVTPPAIVPPAIVVATAPPLPETVDLLDLTTESPTAASPKSKTHKKKLRRPVHSDTVSAIPVASFRRMARYMAEDVKSDLRWEKDALEALQVAAEAFMVEKFQEAKKTSSICARKTISAELLRV